MYFEKWTVQSSCQAYLREYVKKKLEFFMTEIRIKNDEISQRAKEHKKTSKSNEIKVYK